MTYDEILCLFSRRPIRTSPCPHCDGHGHITKSYCLSPYNRAISGAPGNAILAFVSRPVSIFVATHEAHELAMTAQRPIAFLFIGKLVVVHPDDVPDTIGRSGWLEVHGWIPDQTKFQ